MAKRVLLLSEPSPSMDALAQELRARGQDVEATSTIQRVRERTDAGDIDEIVIDATSVPAAGAIEQKVRSLPASVDIVVVRSASSSGNGPGPSEPSSIGVRADRLAALLSDSPLIAPHASRNGAGRLNQVLELLVGLLEVDDRYFGGFTSQVTRLAEEVARGMGLDKPAIDDIITAALLRDIGKIGVQREMRNADGELTPKQASQLEHHVQWGVRLLEHVDFPGDVLSIIRHHHERYDGGGYPDGLQGVMIPLGSRIIAAAESFAAMLSERPHRPAKSFDRAIEELMAGAGSQFDPEVVEVLSRILDTDAVSGLIGRRARIFLVDDDSDYRRLVRLRLLNEGFEVRELPELDSELDVPDDDIPHLVVADAGDDVARFVETMTRIQANSRTAGLPVAVLARAEDRSLKLEALRYGIEDFILKSHDLEEVTARVRNILTRERRRQRGQERRRDGIVGRLENLSVVDIVQMLCLGNKTAHVRIEAPGVSAALFVKDGQVVHAECAQNVGEEAFHDIVRITSGDFQIVHGVTTETRTITASSTFLLMDVVRRVDESAGMDEGDEAGARVWDTRPSSRVPLDDIDHGLPSVVEPDRLEATDDGPETEPDSQRRAYIIRRQHG